jgi:HEPN domain-containing protein
LLRARRAAPGIYLEDLCFDAQQAAEKAVKALFILHGWAFPYTHDLIRLLGLLERNGLTVPKYVRRAGDLTRFAVESRYPGVSGPVTRRGYRTMVRIADAVLGWAERHVRRGGVQGES